MASTGNEATNKAIRFLERPYRDLDFVVYRFVHPSDKRGLPYTDFRVNGEHVGLPGPKVWVEDFAPQWGEFLLDLGEPVYDIQHYHPLVTRIEGYGLDQGRVKYRNLQQLSFPWGIDGTLPVQIWANQVFRDDHRLPFDPKGMSRLDLQWECRRRKLSTKGRRSHLIIRINNAEKKRRVQALEPTAAEALRRLDAVTLPLYRVLEAQDANPGPPLKQPPFDVGEIVLVYGTLAGDDNTCLVRDYEGNRGRIGKAHLEEIQMAFGLKVNRRELLEILERLSWPDEEDEEEVVEEPDANARAENAMAAVEVVRAALARTEEQRAVAELADREAAGDTGQGKGK
ncbi:hypothetical protein SBOR_4977 [Sclerotinia borealis F-4128]|uniref:SAP domain-containing protein n=1 Tax=Sclerotinia borealis (strain F-4128) TaxID=1432307 RepID=W9CJC1_SCLBF|nr:hypothetical protein SBOR_4977 [Sclerotinia borealis F-4128]